MNLITKSAIAGSAIFSMLFGSGNIVFPILFGKGAGNNYFPAYIAWVISAVFIAMAGYYASMLYDSEDEKYFRLTNNGTQRNAITKMISFLLILLVMIISGPFATVPRNINVAYGGFKVLSDAFANNEFLFNVIYTIIVTLLAWKPEKVVAIMGKVISPLKLGGILIIALIAFVKAPNITTTSNVTIGQVFSESFKGGYQTLDLISSFVVSYMIYDFLKNSFKESGKKFDKKIMNKFALMSCIWCAVILSVIYFVLYSIGAKYAPQLDGLDKTSYFTEIAKISIGNMASTFVAIVIAISCLGSAVSLTCVFTDYIYKTILKEKISRNIILLIVSIISFIFATYIGFEGLMNMLGTVLSAICPALIVFVFWRIIYYYHITKNGKQI